MESTIHIRHALERRLEKLKPVEMRERRVEILRHRVASEILKTQYVQDIPRSSYEVKVNSGEDEAAFYLVNLINQAQPNWRASFSQPTMVLKVCYKGRWDEEIPAGVNIFAGPLFKPDKYDDESVSITRLEVACLDRAIGNLIGKAGEGASIAVTCEAFSQAAVTEITSGLSKVKLSYDKPDASNGNVLTIRAPEPIVPPPPGMRI